MTVDRLQSSSRPFGTGISSNSLRWARGGEDAHAVTIDTIVRKMRSRRIGGSLLGSILPAGAHSRWRLPGPAWTDLRSPSLGSPARHHRGQAGGRGWAVDGRGVARALGAGGGGLEGRRRAGITFV